MNMPNTDDKSVASPYMPSRDPALYSLAAANIWVIGTTLYFHADLGTLLWIYFVQSIIIGVFNVIRILSLEHFSTEGVRINRVLVEPTKTTQINCALIFAGTFAFFHLVYAIFLLVLGGKGLYGDDLNLLNIALQSTAFLAHSIHAFILERRRFKRSENIPHIGPFIFFPFIRVLPMHLTTLLAIPALIFAPMGSAILAIFLVLKMFADLAMHVFERIKLIWVDRKETVLPATTSHAEDA